VITGLTGSQEPVVFHGNGNRLRLAVPELLTVDTSVGTPAAVKRVLTGAAVEEIVLSLTEEAVIALTSYEDIPALAALDSVPAVTSVEQIVALVAIDLIPAVPSTDEVVTCPTKDGVVTTQADDDIVAIRPFQVLSSPGVPMIVAGCPKQSPPWPSRSPGVAGTRPTTIDKLAIPVKVALKPSGL